MNVAVLESRQWDVGRVLAAKRILRTALVRERHCLSRAQQVAAARGLRDVFLELPQLREAPCVAVYISRPPEPGTHLLRTALAARGVEVVQPVISRTIGLRWRRSAESLRPHGTGPRRTRRPPDRAPCAVDLDVDLDPDLDVDIVLAPALAVDTQGRRIGLGGDGYDEILRRLDPATLVLVAVHDDELFDSAVEPIPEEPHDVRVDAVLTPSRIRYLTA